MRCDASSILTALTAAAAETHDPDALGRAAIAAIREAMPQTSWAGIYWLEGSTLRLGPFDGPPTEHTAIPVGRGVCGTAVAQDEDAKIDDVRAVDAYLACSPTVRSELVALIRARGEILGQFDLDAEAVGAFSDDDLCVLRTVADSFGALIDPGTQ